MRTVKIGIKTQEEKIADLENEQYIKNNEQYIKNTLTTDIEAEQKKLIDLDHFTNICRESVYGDIMDIYVISLIFEVNILVISKDDEADTLSFLKNFVQFDDNAPMLFLFHKGNHYDALKPPRKLPLTKTWLEWEKSQGSKGNDHIIINHSDKNKYEVDQKGAIQHRPPPIY